MEQGILKALLAISTLVLVLPLALLPQGSDSATSGPTDDLRSAQVVGSTLNATLGNLVIPSIDATQTNSTSALGRFVVRNDGEAPVGPSMAEIRITYPGAHLVLTDQVAVPALLPGATYQGQYGWTTDVFGTYTFRVVADKTKMAVESTRLDNAAETELAHPRPLDLPAPMYVYWAHGDAENVTQADASGVDAGADALVLRAPAGADAALVFRAWAEKLLGVPSSSSPFDVVPLPDGQYVRITDPALLQGSSPALVRRDRADSGLYTLGDAGSVRVYPSAAILSIRYPRDVAVPVEGANGTAGTPGSFHDPTMEIAFGGASLGGRVEVNRSWLREQGILRPTFGDANGDGLAVSSNADAFTLKLDRPTSLIHVSQPSIMTGGEDVAGQSVVYRDNSNTYDYVLPVNAQDDTAIKSVYLPSTALTDASSAYLWIIANADQCPTTISTTPFAQYTNGVLERNFNPCDGTWPKAAHPANGSLTVSLANLHAGLSNTFEVHDTTTDYLNYNLYLPEDTQINFGHSTAKDNGVAHAGELLWYLEIRKSNYQVTYSDDDGVSEAQLPMNAGDDTGIKYLVMPSDLTNGIESARLHVYAQSGQCGQTGTPFNLYANGNLESSFNPCNVWSSAASGWADLTIQTGHLSNGVTNSFEIHKTTNDYLNLNAYFGIDQTHNYGRTVAKDNGNPISGELMWELIVTKNATVDRDNDGLPDYVESATYPDRDVAFCNGSTCEYPDVNTPDLYIDEFWMTTCHGTSCIAPLTSTQVTSMKNLFLSHTGHTFNLHIFADASVPNQSPFGTDSDWVNYSKQYMPIQRWGIFHFGLLADRSTTTACQPGVGAVLGVGSAPGYMFVIYEGCILEGSGSSAQTLIYVSWLHEFGHNLAGVILPTSDQMPGDAFHASNSCCILYPNALTNQTDYAANRWTYNFGNVRAGLRQDGPPGSATDAFVAPSHEDPLVPVDFDAWLADLDARHMSLEGAPLASLGG